MEGLLRVIDLGSVPFDAAMRVQKECLSEALGRPGTHSIIFCSHQPVITCGTAHRASDILADYQTLKEMNINVRQVDRGGGVSYHGPGQITVYPVFNLACMTKDIGWFIRRLEECVAVFLSRFGVDSARKEGFPGVWTGSRKICSIGVGFSKWVSFHGLSVNIRKEDMRAYSLIRPCGMDIKMACLEEESPQAEAHDYAGMISVLLQSFINVFWPRGIQTEEIKKCL
ncbi:MAG: lipoyl(octanoyl) transferase LipB [Candidatus Omnitrophota bacterium]|jgi:lipoate-protein ligase B